MKRFIQTKPQNIPINTYLYTMLLLEMIENLILAFNGELKKLFFYIELEKMIKINDLLWATSTTTMNKGNGIYSIGLNVKKQKKSINKTMNEQSSFGYSLIDSKERQTLIPECHSWNYTII